MGKGEASQVWRNSFLSNHGTSSPGPESAWPLSCVPPSGCEVSGLPSQQPRLLALQYEGFLRSLGDDVMLESSQIIGHTG